LIERESVLTYGAMCSVVGQCDPVVWFFSTSGFHPCSQRCLLVPKPAKQNGGQLATIVRGGPFRFVYGIVMPLLRAAFLSDAEHRDLPTQARFAEVTTKHVSGKNWICATGRRPT
jgi:hypothetical protein